MRGKYFSSVSAALLATSLLLVGCGKQTNQQVNDTFVGNETGQTAESDSDANIGGTAEQGATDKQLSSEGGSIIFAEAVPTTDMIISPASTVEYLSQGIDNAVSADLDGDGINEVIAVSSANSVKEPSSVGRAEYLPEIQVNNLIFTGQYLYELGCYGENPDWEAWYLFDVDVNDSYREIGLYFDGPSGDPATYLFRFQEGQLINLGSFYLYPYSDFDEKLQITVPGDGTITGVGGVNFVETNSATRVWKLEEADRPDANLKEVPLEVYELAQYDRTMGIGEITTKQEISVYNDKSPDAAGVSILEGTEVTFLRFHVSAWGDDAWPAEGWMELTWGDGQIGYFLWSGYGDDGVTTPDGSFWADDLFANLSHAG